MADEPAVRTEEERGGSRAAGYCRGCGTRLEAGEAECPECGLGAEVRCACGQRLAEGDRHCPECGREAPRVMRVRRKAHRRRGNLNELGKYVLVGGIAALLLGVAGQALVVGLAQRAVGPYGKLPPGLGEQLRLAGEGLGDWWSGMTQVGGQMFSGISLILLFLGVGVVVGALLYLWQADLLRLPGTGSRKKRYARRRRAE